MPSHRSKRSRRCSSVETLYFDSATSCCFFSTSVVVSLWFQRQQSVLPVRRSLFSVDDWHWCLHSIDLPVQQPSITSRLLTSIDQLLVSNTWGQLRVVLVEHTSRPGVCSDGFGISDVLAWKKKNVDRGASSMPLNRPMCTILGSQISFHESFFRWEGKYQYFCTTLLQSIFSKIRLLPIN